MKKIRILDISDMQNGFTRESGKLYVQGAQDIIAPINKFISQVRNGIFDYTLIVLDTHFTEEYSQTEESKMFPIHCEFGTNDWELSIDTPAHHNTLFLTKNQFDMWSENGLKDIVFSDKIRKSAYNNLFYFLDNPINPATRVTRDDFVKAMSPDCNLSHVEVTIIGVASDYCNRYAMEGWLDRGAAVTIIHDLTKGIEKETPQILNESKYKEKNGGKLRSISSNDFLRELADS